MKKQILSILLVVCLVLNMMPDMAYAEAAVKITYNANGGSGFMEEGTTTENMLFTLPDCTFTPPEGKLFQCWAIGSTEGTQLENGGSYTFTNDTTVYAVWKDTFSITTTTLPDATVGTTYHQALTVTGSAINLSTIAWSVADGSLPTGLGLDTSTGEINGTPTTEGSTTLTIKASDGTNSDATRVFTIKVLGGTGEEGITSWIDLKEAISKANASEHTIITIGADFNTSSAAAWDPINISKSKHITLQSAASGNFTITRADGNQGRFFTISENGSLTLRNITLDGGGENLSKAPYSPLIGASNISGTTQDLILESGAVLQNNHTRGECGGAIKFESGNITMNSGSMIQNNSSDTGGGGIYLLNSTLTMNEGMICNNTVTGSGGKKGGGVQVSSNMGSGVFNMRGGSITDNTAYMGGGVYISGGDSVVFNLSGGEITGNTATGYIGGGVYLGSGSFRNETELNGALMNIVGNPVISGNKGVINPSSIVVSDLYIQGINPGITTKPAILQKNGQLTSGASVGVVLMKTNNATILVSDGTHAVTEADAAYFFSNRATSTIEYDSELEALVAVENSSAPIITTDTLPDGILGTAYSQTLAATGTTPITWSVTEGDLPSGLSLDSSTGVISGTPTAAVTNTFTVQASNGTAPVATKELSITITKAAVTIWDGSIAQYFDGGEGTEDKPYQIRTAEQLALLANVISGAASKIVVEGQAVQPYEALQKAYYKLTADIKLNDTTKVTEWNKNAPTNNWIPIGRIHAPFRGVFDGGNYTVSGLYSNKSTVDYYGFVGLFGYTDDIIKNVTVKDGYIDGYDNVNSYVAGIAGRNDGTIDNCHNIVTLVAKHYAGGIVAYNSGKIKDCSNAGNITTTETSDHSCGAGGIVSVNSDSSSLIENCTNFGNIVGAERVGGICGHQQGIIKNCINTGNISGLGIIGGIIGIQMYGEVSNCINIGMVSGEGVVGGILGKRLASTIENVFSPKGVTQGATSDIGTSSPSYGYLIGYEQVSGSYTGASDSYGGITVSPASATVAQGNTNTFSVNGMKSGDTVEWMVGGGISATTTNANGMLTVAGNETAKSLTVIAIVKTNSVVTGVGIAAITIETLPTVTGVTITPNSVNMARGSAQLFSAEVTGVNNPVQTVDWSIVETVKIGTSINANGLLTVAEGETATSLTIKATSTVDNTKSGTATVTITTDSGKVWNGTSAQYFDGGLGTEGDPYLIRTAEQLALFADVMNEGEAKQVVEKQNTQTYEYLNWAYYKLTADIILNDTAQVSEWEKTAPSNSWKPIGESIAKPVSFYGVFEGDQHTISGLYLNKSTDTYDALIGMNNGTIQNVTVRDGYVSGKLYVAAIVGYNRGTIDNCHNTINLVSEHQAGGIASRNIGTIKNCTNSGDVTMGTLLDKMADSCVGGIVANNGYVSKPSSGSCIIENCTNSGKIVGKIYPGGIVGISHEYSTVARCTNTGSVSGLNSVGGICGRQWGSEAVLKDCLNLGVISGTGIGVGGIAGNNFSIIKDVFSPKGVTLGATTDIGEMTQHWGHIVGYQSNGSYSGSSDSYGDITVSPASVVAARGNTKTFTVKGMKEGDTVEWSVAGGISKTTISTNGMLTVADNETAKTLTVIAVVKTNNLVTGVGIAAVTIETLPTVTGVTITPTTATVIKSKTQQFTAIVTGNNNPPQEVDWKVIGGVSGTGISDTGLLTVAADETATKLTVTATSVEDTTKSVSATVTVEELTTVVSVEVTPNSVNVARGSAQLFSAEVTGVNNPVQTVTWSIMEAVQAGTSIDAKGLLTVASGETTTSLTIKATSTADNTKSGTATVTITTDSGKVWNGTSAQYFDGGLGTVNDPYQIRTAEQLALLADVINGDTSKKVTKEQVVQTYAYLQTATYVLTADINLNNISNVAYWGTTAPSNSWKIIGKSNTFNGVFDGKNYIVSGLYYNGSTNAGLFGNSIGTIKNLNVSDGYIKGTRYVGGVVGIISSADAKIYNCNNSCTVNGTEVVGGVVGGSGGEVNNCSNSGRIDGGREVGGVVGVTWEGKIQNCINTGYISAYGTSDSGYCSGGVLGANNGATISNIFSPKGYVKNATVNYGNEINSYVGYLVGWGSATNSGSDSYGSITISPASATLAKGGTKTFMINGKQSNDTVEWSVSSGISGTMINDNGMLTVAVNETASKLTVTAVVKTNGMVTGAGSAMITIGIPSTVTGVTVTPTTATVRKSKTQQFTAIVTGNNNPPQEVDWKVIGGVSGTGISDTGLLTVAADETATKLTVTATSVEDTTKSASATVTVEELTKVVSVNVTPNSVNVARGTIQQFSSAVTGENSPVQTVTWSIVEMVQTGTGIDAKGLLTVSSGETATTLTIKATSTADNTKSGTAIVTVKATTDSGKVWDGTSALYFDGGLGTKEDPYQIRTAEQLALFADVMNGSTYKKVVEQQNIQHYNYLQSAYYKLTADIKLNDTTKVSEWETIAPSNGWKTIGDTSTEVFKGVFEGNQHTISGLYHNKSTNTMDALFGWNRGTIQNVTVKDGYVSGKNYVAAIVGSNFGTIDNCHNTINVVSEHQGGGIASRNYGTIKNCSNSGDVTMGTLLDKMSNSCVGGIVAYNGDEYQPSNGAGYIENCTNSGKIVGKIYTGGIVGISHNHSMVDRCTNTGNVVGHNSVGGICGRQWGLQAVLKDCLNSGVISGTGTIVGGIVGNNTDGVIKDVFSPKGATLGATTDIGEASQYWGHIVGYQLNGSYSGGSDSYGNITVSPASVVVARGNTKTFTVKGMKEGDTVEWSVHGGNSGTVINANGMLTVADNETAEKLEVAAVVKTKGVLTGAGSAIVTTNSGTIWNGTSSQYFDDGTGTTEDPYQIRTAEQLALFSDVINGNMSRKVTREQAIQTSDYLHAAYYKLTADIKLNDTTKVSEWEAVAPSQTWRPIGGGMKPFTGVFDGDNNTISGLYYNSTYTVVGLFLSNHGTIKNVIIKDGYVTGNTRAAGIVASNYGTINNCHNSIPIASKGNAGGIAAESSNNGIIENCTNSGKINGERAGGIVGDSGSSTVTLCTNTGTVSGTVSAGGIIGYMFTSSLGDCINTGMISGDLYVGGITGALTGGTINKVFSPKGVTQGATTDVGQYPIYRGYTIGFKLGGNYTSGSDNYSDITVSPASATVVQGATKTFSASGMQEGDTVEWSVAGGISKTTISINGMLTVAGNETAKTLTVTAVVKTNGIVTGVGSAKVTVSSEAKLYTVTFDSQGGSTVSSVGVTKEGKTITLPEVPTRNGYRFGGWFTQVNGGGMSFTTLTPVTVNITVYAKWTKVINLSGTVYWTDASYAQDIFILIFYENKVKSTVLYQKMRITFLPKST